MPVEVLRQPALVFSAGPAENLVKVEPLQVSPWVVKRMRVCVCSLVETSTTTSSSSRGLVVVVYYYETTVRYTRRLSFGGKAFEVTSEDNHRETEVSRLTPPLPGDCDLRRRATVVAARGSCAGDPQRELCKLRRTSP